jgi:hypothetical protein
MLADILKGLGKNGEGRDKRRVAESREASAVRKSKAKTDMIGTVGEQSTCVGAIVERKQLHYFLYNNIFYISFFFFAHSVIG